VGVGVIGDSHSDVDRDPRYDWEISAPTHWLIYEHAVSGAKCWEIVPQALADGVGGEVLVVYCGTNDAGRSDWSLDTTSGWILNGVLHGLSQGRKVVVVTPPPAFRDYPVSAALRNQRLAELRDRIFAFAAGLEFEVADIWDAVWQHPEPESLFDDGLHFTGPGRYMSSQVISEAVQRARER
jgi:hypothetical protein